MGEPYKEGIDLLRHRRFFEAHEALELAWRAAPDDERDFYQGLVHVAVAWYQAGRGRTIGATRQLEKALRRLERYEPSHLGIDVRDLRDQLRRAHATVVSGSLDLPPPQL
jgi:hypothetical protein